MLFWTDAQCVLCFFGAPCVDETASLRQEKSNAKRRLTPQITDPDTKQEFVLEYLLEFVFAHCDRAYKVCMSLDVVCSCLFCYNSFNWLVHDACHQEASGSAAPAPKRPKEAIYGKLLYRAAGYCRIVFFEDFISFREYRDIKIDKTYFA